LVKFIGFTENLGFFLGSCFGELQTTVNHSKKSLPDIAQILYGLHWLSLVLNPSESIAISLPLKKSNDFPFWLKKPRWIPFERDRREHVLGKANFGYVSLVKQYYFGEIPSKIPRI